ncbi:MAG: 3-deoxy-7-phosphoheptulonate synthase [Christensenellaceae bacterium]|nr:3-deoxy-7-phosphoheptulonate synthase [Christensenellaceae bacterium]
MIVILKHNSKADKIKALIHQLESTGLSIHYSEGSQTTILGLIGDTSRVDVDNLQATGIVEAVRRVTEPYKAANRKFHTDDTVIHAGSAALDGGHFGVIAGPCSIETEEQIIAVAEDVKKAGATMLRGGAFKPRTSPYSFQGLGAEGLRLLLAAKAATGLPVVTELMNLAHLDLFADVDIIQVGARNMQNFEMLKELGHCKKPILLKRGLSSTIEEWLMSAEYIMSTGNEEVILCERGIRTFETAMRNTLDLAAIPLLKTLTHLPVIVDPSHATGMSRLVPPMAKAAVISGADGLMIEVHNHPEKALCDGAQSLTPVQFGQLMGEINALLPLSGKQF